MSLKKIMNAFKCTYFDIFKNIEDEDNLYMKIENSCSMIEVFVSLLGINHEIEFRFKEGDTIIWEYSIYTNDPTWETVLPVLTACCSDFLNQEYECFSEYVKLAKKYAKGELA